MMRVFGSKLEAEQLNHSLFGVWHSFPLPLGEGLRVGERELSMCQIVLSTQ